MALNDWDILVEWPADEHEAKVIYHLMCRSIDNLIKYNTIKEIIGCTTDLCIKDMPGKPAVILYHRDGGELNLAASTVLGKEVRGGAVVVPKFILEEWRKD